jgi:hypothetical protein
MKSLRRGRKFLMHSSSTDQFYSVSNTYTVIKLVRRFAKKLLFKGLIQNSINLF